MAKQIKKDIQARNVLRVALYVRVSSQEQADEGYSIGVQTERLQKYADAMGWEIYKVYVDPGYSGGNIDRPGLNQMIKDVESGKIDTVVVYKLDRLSRSQFDTLYLIEKVFLANNTDFVSMTENFNTNSPLGRAMIGFLAVFAQLEKDKIHERTIMGKEARAKEGKWGGGSSEPIGYDYDPTTERLYVNEYEKMQVLEAVDLFLKGTPLRRICTIFTEKGYKYRGRSKKLHDWDPKRLKYVFASKVYLGYISYGGEWFPSDHEPIYDVETYEKLQKLLSQRKEEFAQHTKRCAGQTTYLGGMLYCKKCGAKFTKQKGKKWKDLEPPVYYTCYSRCKKTPKMVKDPNCKNKNWRMADLDNIILDEVKKLSTDPNYIHDVRADKLTRADDFEKIEILKAEIKSIDDQISRFMDLYGIGKFTIDQVSAKVDPLNDQKKLLEKELESLTSSTGEIDDEEVFEIVNSFDAVLKRGDINEIRLMLESLIFKIELDEDDVIIHWKFA
jgi:site-specific DNA recombinase